MATPAPGEPGGPPLGVPPGADPGAPPDYSPGPDDSTPAVEPGTPRSTSAPPAGGFVPWSQVVANPRFQQLSDDQKRKARYQYFDEVVKPRIPQDKWALALHQFERDTAPKVATQPGQPPKPPAIAPGEGPTAKWIRSGMSGPPPDQGKPPQPGSPAGFGPMLDQALKAVPALEPVVGLNEVGLHALSGVASSLVGQPLQGLSGAVDAPAGQRMAGAAEAQRKGAEADVYQPRTATGKAVSSAVDTVLGLYPRAIDRITLGPIDEKTGKRSGGLAESETLKAGLGPEGAKYAAAGANTALNALPNLLGLRGGGAAAGAGEAVAARAAKAATTRAKEFVESKTALKWDEVPKGMQDKLIAVAKDKDRAALERLKPSAIERQARAEELKLPMTRGEIERDIPQVTHEQTLRKSASGEPLANIRSGQDTRLGRLVAIGRRATGAKATSRQEIGESVQHTALRGKPGEEPQKWGKAEIEKGLQSSAKGIWSKANYHRLFGIARETNPDVTVSPEPLVKMLDENPAIQHLGFMEGWLKKAKVKLEPEESAGLVDAKGKPLSKPKQEFRGVRLDELADLRSKAARIAREGIGSERIHAGDVVHAVDEAMAKVPESAAAWRTAYDAFKKHNIEFEDQELVAKLNDMKSRTDPRTAMEKTTATVLKHSSTDIRGLRKTLTEGGTAKTRAAGTQAWKNIQGGALDHLFEKATGDTEIEGADGELEFKSGFRREFNKLERDGKIDAIFDPKIAVYLRKVNKSIGDVRSPRSSGQSGSDTAANLRAASERNTLQALTLGEKVAAVPYVGKYIAGGAKLGRKIIESGQAARDVGRAKISKLDEAAAAATSRAKWSRRKKSLSRNTLKSLQASSVSRATLQDDNKEQP